jgi:hypothetical protein
LQFPPTVPPAVPDGPAGCGALLCELLEADGREPEPLEPPSLNPRDDVELALEDVELATWVGDTWATTGALLADRAADRL